MWCRSAPRPSFPRTPIELHRCFATPAWQRFAADEAGEAYLAECPLTSPAGRFPPPASRTRQGLVAAGSPITRMRLVRAPGLDDGGDRAPSDQDRHGASLAGEPDRRPSRPDRRPSRPVVSPTYAQGSYYGTNRVVAGAPGRFAGPAAPLLSTTRAAQPPGRDPSRLGSSVVRTARVSRKNRPRGRGRARGGDCTRPARCARPPPGRARTPCVARNEPTPRRRPSSGSRRLPDQHSQGHYASPPSRRRPR